MIGGFDGTHSFVVKLALDLPSPLGRLAVCPAMPVWQNVNLKQKAAGGRSKDFGKLVEHASPRNGGSRLYLELMPMTIL